MRRRDHAHALLIDFDGVVRDWNRPPNPRHEEFLAAGLAWNLYVPMVTGKMPRTQWLDAIKAETGATDSEIAGWFSYRGEISKPVMDFVAEVRAAGRPVALCTNATDDLREDLALHGLSDAFDVVVSSWELGTYKPTRDFYVAACVAVKTVPKLCLLVDDTHRNVEGARAAGLSAMRWTGPDDIDYLRSALGLN